MTFFIIIILVPFLVMTLAFCINQKVQNAGIVDVFWGLGIALVGIFLGTTLISSPIALVFIALVVLWALRLSIFLLVTRLLKQHKDRRYTRLEDKWGDSKKVKLLLNFYFQASLQMLISFCYYPLLYANKESFSIVQILAIILFAIALLGESIADFQLYKFRKSKVGGICKVGLWSYSRHPNYFFEWLIWVSLAIYCSTLQYFMVVWVAPLVVWIIVRYITAPYTERLSLQKYGDAFSQYQKEVPIILPNLTNQQKNG